MLGRGGEEDQNLVYCPAPHKTRTAGSPDITATLNSGGNAGGFRTEPGEHLVVFQSYGAGAFRTGDVSLDTTRNQVIAMHDRPGADGDVRHLVGAENIAYCLDNSIRKQMIAVPAHGETAFSLLASSRGGKDQAWNSNYVAMQSTQNAQAKPCIDQMIRRLTPTECLRLQAFPDDWLDLDPPMSDSVKYRVIGNAVTRNVAKWIGQRIKQACPEVSTYGELFAGIGGFSGFEYAGLSPVFMVEIDKDCQRVLRKHWPNVPLHSDIRDFPPK
jgi:hypothetical protein